MRTGIVVVLLAIAALGSARDASAVQVMCLQDFGSCIRDAASEDNFWIRTIKALDCEISLWSCLKEALLF